MLLVIMNCVLSFLFDCGDFVFMHSLFVCPVLLLTICGVDFEAFTKTPVLPSAIIIIPIVLLILIPTRFALGCFGWKAEQLAAEKDIRHPLILFIILLGIILSLLTRFIILTGTSDLPNYVEKWITDGFIEDRMESFYLLERNHKCCGTSGATSYIAKNWSIPVTCCKNTASDDVNQVRSVYKLLANNKDMSNAGEEDESFTNSISNGINDFVELSQSKLNKEYKVSNDGFCTIDNAFDGCNKVVVDYFYTLVMVNIGFTSVIGFFDLVTILFAVFVIYELKANEPKDPNTVNTLGKVQHQLEEQLKF